MEYINISEAAKNWKVSERTARYYCSQGRVEGSVMEGKTWKVPEGAKKPARKQKSGKIPTDLLTRLRAEQSANVPGGIYHKVQIELTYNSNHIEGSKLSHDQTRHIFETSTIGASNESIKIDDIIEAANHFRCVDKVIDLANYKLSQSFIKQLHMILKNGTSDSRKPWFATGDYKRLPNQVAGYETARPEDVASQMDRLLKQYNKKKVIHLEDIAEFHYLFERIHPFQDGNGRIGRLIMFKECLRNGIVPFIIQDNVKDFYYRGLNEWPKDRRYLMDTCLFCQDKFKEYMDYFNLEYEEQ